LNKVDIVLDRWWKLIYRFVRRKIFGAATVVAALTLVTQLGSITRELTVAAWFGTADCLDVFLIAFLLLIFVINVVAGSFNAAFIPTFIHVRMFKPILAQKKIMDLESILLFKL